MFNFINTKISGSNRTVSKTGKISECQLVSYRNLSHTITFGVCARENINKYEWPLINQICYTLPIGLYKHATYFFLIIFKYHSVKLTGTIWLLWLVILRSLVLPKSSPIWIQTHDERRTTNQLITIKYVYQHNNIFTNTIKYV